MTIHIHTVPTEDVLRQPLDGERWCFRCRKRRSFDYVVIIPAAMSYYGPTPSIRCTACDLIDGDLFPGRSRDWEDA